MHVKVFVLGRPGSGKSTAARHLNQHFKDRGWSTVHINDYDILRQMFLADVEQQKFRPTANNGFDAIDLSVLDVALYEVEKRVEDCPGDTELITIEFARDDYRHALQQFSPDFLQDACILFMDTDLETCLRRVHARVRRSTGTDDHPSFSDDIFRSYYRRENCSFMLRGVIRDFPHVQKVEIIDNSGSLEDCVMRVRQFAERIEEIPVFID